MAKSAKEHNFFGTIGYHIHSHEHEHEHEDLNGSSEEEQSQSNIGVALLVCALSVHALFEGLSLAVTSDASQLLQVNHIEITEETHHETCINQFTCFTDFWSSYTAQVYYGVLSWSSSCPIKVINILDRFCHLSVQCSSTYRWISRNRNYEVH